MSIDATRPVAENFFNKSKPKRDEVHDDLVLQRKHLLARARKLREALEHIGGSSLEYVREELKRVSKAATKITKDINLRITAMNEKDLCRALGQNDGHGAWAAIHRLAKRGLGARGRAYGTNPARRRARAESVVELQREGKFKGLRGETIAFEEFAANYNEERLEEKLAEDGDTIFPLTEDVLEAAARDFKETKKMPLHRAVPPWGLPTGLLKTLVFPAWRDNSRDRGGVGVDWEPLKAPHAYNFIGSIFVHTRATGYTSNFFNRSYAVYYGNATNDRLLHIVDPLGSALSLSR